MSLPYGYAQKQNRQPPAPNYSARPAPYAQQMGGSIGRPTGPQFNMSQGAAAPAGNSWSQYGNTQAGYQSGEYQPPQMQRPQYNHTGPGSFGPTRPSGQQQLPPGYFQMPDGQVGRRVAYNRPGGIPPWLRQFKQMQQYMQGGASPYPTSPYQQGVPKYVNY